MKINFNLPLTQYDGSPYQINDQPLTLLKAVQVCLNSTLETDRTLTPTQMYELGQIGSLAQTDTPLTSEQISKLKERVSKVWSPALTYQIHLALEGE